MPSPEDRAAGPHLEPPVDLAAALAGAPPTRLLAVGTGPLAVLDAAATAEQRATAVLVPGYTGSKEDFLPVLPLLTAAGVRVVALDQRGQFSSPGPDDPGAYTVAALAQDLLGLLDALGDGPVHLVGHSFGGLVCRAAVLQRPAAARSLVLLASGPGAITGPRVERMQALGPLLQVGGMPAVHAAMERMAEATADPSAPPVPEAWRELLRTRFAASSAAGLSAMGEALLGEPDRVGELAAVGLPLLVLHGDRDDAWSPAVQADMAHRLGAAHVVLPDVAHSPAVEAPVATAAALLGFWRHQ